MGIPTEKCTEGKEMNEHRLSKGRGVFFFSAEARPHFSIKLDKHKLEKVKKKYICKHLCKQIELSNTMEINSPNS